jgi:polar amino acid transport system substrate-binding protein
VTPDQFPSADEPMSRALTRRSVLQRGLGGLALMAAGPIVAGCGGGNSGSSGGGGGGGGGGALEKLRSAGVARMAVTETLPSSGFQNGKGVAVFPEIGAMVMKELGVPKIEYVNMQFGAQIPSLVADRVDMAAGGLYLTAERCNAISLSDTLLAYLEGLAVKKGNPKGIVDYKTIAQNNLKLGLVTGSFENDLAKQFGVKTSQIQLYPDIPAMYEALKAGRVDAAGYDSITIAYFAEEPQYSSAVEAIKPFDPVDDGLPSSGIAGMGFQKDATDLTREFNKVADKMLQDGKFDEIYKKWRVPEIDIKLTKTSPPTDEFCKKITTS